MEKLRYFQALVMLAFIFNLGGCTSENTSETVFEEQNTEADDSLLDRDRCTQERIVLQVKYLKEFTPAEKAKIKESFEKYFTIYEVIPSEKCKEYEAWIVNCFQYKANCTANSSCEANQEENTEVQKMLPGVNKECFNGRF